ncbi:hypothetical protein P7C71_g1382, partial [Lecanoromycetidae sp. Uapishka_2]
MNDNNTRERTNGNFDTAALTEINPNVVTGVNGSSSQEATSNTTNVERTVERKKASVTNSEEVEADGDAGIERDIPGGDDQDDGEDSKDPDTQLEMGTKKKKKRKPKSKRGLNAPTGFEEYYVDAPLTPAEFEEEKSIYDSRIEKAVQRYVAKRNLDPERKTIFDRYLINGGVEAGPKMFSGGLDTTALESMNAEEIAEQSATNYVGADRGEPGDPVWVVDFEGCLKSFLSSRFAAQWEITSHEKLKYLVNIIRNFLNYLLHHDVCPEYQGQINASRAVCDKAEKELWKIAQVTPLLPGDFNMACSEIFGGMYQGMYSENQAWMEGLDIDYQCGISPARARNVFKVALAANANDELFQKYSKQLQDKSWYIDSVEDTGFEITDIEPPTNTARSLYAQGQYADLKIVGKMRAKTWSSPNKEDEDLTEEEEAALATTAPKVKDYEFWIEEELLQKLFVGMKFDTKVTQLSFGVFYFDHISGVHCSFYQVLPNEMMSGWRDPEKQWLPMKKKNMLARTPDGSLEQHSDDEEPNTGNGVTSKEDVETKHAEDDDIVQSTEDTDDNVAAIDGIDVEGQVVKDVTNAPQEEPKEDHSVNVRKTGGEFIDVPANPDKVFEQTFNVEKQN